MEAGKKPLQTESMAAFAAARSIGAPFDIWVSVWQTPAAIIRKSEERLRTLIELARDRVPLYQRLYRNVAANNGLRLADLPVVNKRMLMNDLGASLAIRDLPQQEV